MRAASPLGGFCALARGIEGVVVLTSFKFEVRSWRLTLVRRESPLGWSCARGTKGVLLPILLWCATLGETSAQSDLLLKPNSELRNDPVATEQILDMVDVWVGDSILPRKTEHHHVPGGFLFPLVGLKWEYIEPAKQKFVGTIVGFGVNEHGALTENDVCFDIASRLPHYQQLAFEGYQAQKEIGRRKSAIDYNSTPFDTLPTNETWQRYYLHCEVTPPRERLQVLDSMFFPTEEGDRLSHHPNFDTVNRQIGVYGAFCSDCNHACHPEIHPYEWIWWLDLTQPDSIRKWYFGLFKEGSNRFPKWSKREEGTITIPFSIRSEADSVSILCENDESIDTLFMGALSDIEPLHHVLFYPLSSEFRTSYYETHWEPALHVPGWPRDVYSGYVLMRVTKDAFAGSVTFRWW